MTSANMKITLGTKKGRSFKKRGRKKKKQEDGEGFSLESPPKKKGFKVP